MPEDYLSIVQTTLSTMLQIALPQVNILSKSSLMSENKLSFDLESYLDCRNLEYLVDCIPGRENGLKKKMYRQIVDAIVDLPWVSFSLFDFKVRFVVLLKCNRLKSDVCRRTRKASRKW